MKKSLDQYTQDAEDFLLDKASDDASLESYYSYLRAKEIQKSLPKKFGVSDTLEFYRLFKEVHARKDTSATLFRKNDSAPDALKTVWLSRVRETAQAFNVLNKTPHFNGIELSTLASIGKKSVDPSGISKLQLDLSNLGIILIYERALPGIKLDGAAFRLSNGIPVVALSLRYSRLDHFWFTLMHELAHIALHYDQLCNPIIDDLDESGDNETEVEANKAAANALISRSDWRSCNALYVQSDEEVKEFAQRTGVHASIVAGRIRRELNRHTAFSKIINEFNVREILFNEK